MKRAFHFAELIRNFDLRNNGEGWVYFLGKQWILMLQGATKPIYSICLGFSCLEHFNILLPMNAAPVFSSLSGIKKILTFWCLTLVTF